MQQTISSLLVSASVIKNQIETKFMLERERSSQAVSALLTSTGRVLYPKPVKITGPQH